MTYRIFDRWDEFRSVMFPDGSQNGYAGKPKDPNNVIGAFQTAIKFFAQEPSITGHRMFEMQNFKEIPRVKRANAFRMKRNRHILQIQNATGIDSMPEIREGVDGTFTERTPYDDGWMMFFTNQPLEKDDSFILATYKDEGLAWVEMKGGSSIDYMGSYADYITIGLKVYGLGFAIDRGQLFRRAYFDIEQGLISWRAGAYLTRANVFTGLIEAIPAGQNISWQQPYNPDLANTNEAFIEQRDVATLQLGIQTLRANNRKRITVMPPGMRMSYPLLFDENDEPRVKRALGLMVKDYQSDRALVGNIIPVPTVNLVVKDKWYLGIPGGYNRIVEGFPMQTFDEFDIDTYNWRRAGWISWGGTVGQPEQFQRLSTS